MCDKPLKVGIIGGSGFYKLEELENTQDILGLTTEFGDPASVPVEGTIGGVPCVVLAR